MACRTAYLIRTPEVEEVTEREVEVYNSTDRKWERHYEPFLIPEYRVGFTYDFGFCCGVDHSEFVYASREEAEQAIKDVYDNKHSWIMYDPDYMEDDNGNDD